MPKPDKPCVKMKFETEPKAKEFNKGLSPYFCNACNCWHLTSNGGFKLFKDSGSPQAAFEWIQSHSMSRKREQNMKLKKQKKDHDESYRKSRT